MVDTAIGESPGEAGQAADPSSVDERIKAFQRREAEKDRQIEKLRKDAERAASLERRLEELELAQMSESERETRLTQRERAEVERLKVELEQAKLAAKYPQVAPHFQALFAAQTAEEQALYLQQLLNPKPAAGAPEDDISDIDMNNPMRGPKDPISLPPGEVNDQATADRILKAFGNAPASAAHRY